jgi:osmotically-inducible protein OsmY
MRSAKAFVLGIGTALVIDRVRARRRSIEPEIVDDVTIEHRVLGDALPAAGVTAEQVDVDVDDGVVTLHGSVQGADTADELVSQVARVPGVRDVAAMIRVSERRAA